MVTKMKKFILLAICLMFTLPVSALGAETEAGRITLTQLLGVNRAEAKSITISVSGSAGANDSVTVN